MKVLVTSHHPQWPVNGGSARTIALAKQLAALGHEVALLHPGHTPLEHDLIGHAEVVTVSSPPVGQKDWPGWLRATKRAVAPLPTAAGARSPAMFEEVKRRKPDVLLVHGAYGAYLRDAAPDAHLWIDFHDLMSRIAAREATFLPWPSSLTARVQARVFGRAERSITRRAAIVTAAGYADATELRAFSPEAAWLPTPVEGPAEVPPMPGRKRIGFIGSFAYEPNRDALRCTLETWLPAIRAAGWTLVVAGRGAGELDLPPDVLNLGEVGRLDDFYGEIDAAIVAMRRGGGMKVKVVEALAWGRPVLGTPFAFEGFDALPATGSLGTVGTFTLEVPMPPDESSVDSVQRRFGESAMHETVAARLDGLTRNRVRR